MIPEPAIAVAMVLLQGMTAAEGSPWALILLGVVAVVAIVLAMMRRRRPADPEPAPAPAASQAEAHHVHSKGASLINEGIPPHVLAVISAATFAALGKPFKIRRVRPAGPGSSSWADAGRTSIQSSHNIRRSL